ncbi:MAG: clan AA aspartic protease [Lysobacter sp.]|nr:clan AA aspartic protease [Lysobacter sp.]
MNIFFRLIPVAVALCAAGITGCASTRVAMSAQGNEAVSIPFTLSKQNNIVVEVRINDSHIVHLMLHSASSDVTLTEEAVRRLGDIALGNDAKIQSWGGTSDSRYSTGNRMRIGPLTRDGVTLWENRNSGEGTDGKFGLDFFGDAVVEIDYDSGRIVVHDRLPDKARDYQSLAIENEDGELYVEGLCLFGDETRANRFLIHSGYAGGLLLDDAFAASSGIDGRIAITETSRLTDSYGHVIEVKKGVMPGFSLGRLTLSDVPVGFFSGRIGNQDKSVLGGAILKRFNLIFDLGRKKLYLRPRGTQGSQRPA